MLISQKYQHYVTSIPKEATALDISQQMQANPTMQDASQPHNAGSQSLPTVQGHMSPFCLKIQAKSEMGKIERYPKYTDLKLYRVLKFLDLTKF